MLQRTRTGRLVTDQNPEPCCTEATDPSADTLPTTTEKSQAFHEEKENDRQMTLTRVTRLCVGRCVVCQQSKACVEKDSAEFRVRVSGNGLTKDFVIENDLRTETVGEFLLIKMEYKQGTTTAETLNCVRRLAKLTDCALHYRPADSKFMLELAAVSLHSQLTTFV